MAKAIQTCSRKNTEDPECSAGARKPKPSVESEEFAKEEVTEIRNVPREQGSLNLARKTTSEFPELEERSR
jgi:hypothetical protein